jgi:hypothetical protein
LSCKKNFLILFGMKKAREPQHKRGPKPMAEQTVKASFVLPQELWDWAAEQPEGASALLRALLTAERKRRART